MQDNQIIAREEIISWLLNCVIISEFYKVRRTLNHWFSRTDLAISFHEIHCHWSNSSLHCTPLQISLSQHFSPQSHENMMKPGQLSWKHALSDCHLMVHHLGILLCVKLNSSLNKDLNSQKTCGGGSHILWRSNCIL